MLIFSTTTPVSYITSKMGRVCLLQAADSDMVNQVLFNLNSSLISLTKTQSSGSDGAIQQVVLSVASYRELLRAVEHGLNSSWIVDIDTCGQVLANLKVFTPLFWVYYNCVIFISISLTFLLSPSRTFYLS